jgi:hypothetical protein
MHWDAGLVLSCLLMGAIISTFIIIHVCYEYLNNFRESIILL